ncbi:MAG: addiction module protein [Candidatus Hinthialibacter antarcticus]|nr:addiction module protein [Candidatus Hinthialibacter antarcticus]
MSARELLIQALKLEPEDRFSIVEGLIQSLDAPNKHIDDLWAHEAEQRLLAYREGKLGGIAIEDVFKED